MSLTNVEVFFRAKGELFSRNVLASALVCWAFSFAAHAQAPTPEDHPGYPLAQAIAASGCVLHQDDVNALMEEAGLENALFPQMAVPLMQTGFLRSTGNGTLTLVNWGVCTGDAPVVAPEAGVSDAEATGEASE